MGQPEPELGLEVRLDASKDNEILMRGEPVFKGYYGLVATTSEVRDSCSAVRKYYCNDIVMRAASIVFLTYPGCRRPRPPTGA